MESLLSKGPDPSSSQTKSLGLGNKGKNMKDNLVGHPMVVESPPVTGCSNPLYVGPKVTSELLSFVTVSLKTTSKPPLSSLARCLFIPLKNFLTFWVKKSARISFSRNVPQVVFDIHFNLYLFSCTLGFIALGRGVLGWLRRFNYVIIISIL